MTSAAFGELLDLLAAIAFFSLIVAVANRKSIGRWLDRDRPVPDGPGDEPYRAYTTRFDREMAATDVAAELRKASPDFARGWFQTSEDARNVAADATEHLVKEKRSEFLVALASLPADYFAKAAVTLLIDHSGSMRGMPIRWAAVTVRLVTEALMSMGAKVEVLGFSTAGWHGGFAYQRWMADKKPRRPGRLAALLHIVYRTFENPEFDRAAWRAMLDPNLLRENIDGEALEWASSRLRLRNELHKLLIIVSDGAPVDDATLMHNGSSYLYRHLMQVIRDVEADPDIALGAVGIGYKVSEYHPISVVIEHADAIPTAVAELLERLSSIPPS